MPQLTLRSTTPPPCAWCGRPTVDRVQPEIEAYLESRHDLLAFLDADDRWVQSKLTHQLAALAGEPELDAVFGHVRQFVSPDVWDEVIRCVRIPEIVMPAQLPHGDADPTAGL